MEDKNKKHGPKIEALLEYANSIIATLREPFLVLDKRLQIISANQSFYETFKVTEKDTIGQLLPDLGNKQWNIPALLTLLKEIIPGKKVVQDYEVEHKFEQIGQRVMSLNACQLRVPREIAAIISAGAIEEEEEEELILLAIEDITERKRLQEDLKNSEERFRKTFETSKDGLLLIHKAEGDILNSNKSAQELLGYSQDEFLKKKLWDIGMVKDNSEFQQAALKLEKDGIINYPDLQVRTKEGLNIAADAFLVDRAKVIQCNIREITERKKAEKELRESEERYRILFDAAPITISITTPEGKLLIINRAIEDMLGYSPQEFEKINMNDIYVEPGERSRMMALLQKDGKVRNYEAQVRRKDGCISILLLNAIWVEFGGKKLVLSIGRDITERKKAEEGLKQERDFSQSLIDTAQAIILVLGTNGAIISFNKYMEDLSGYKLEEVRGKDWFSTFIPEIDRDRIRELFQKAVGGIQTRGNDNPITAKDGRLIDIEWYDKILKDESGKIVGLLSIGQDVTGRKKMESEIVSLSKFPSENPNPVLRIAEDGTILYSNQSGMDLLAKWGVEIGGKAPERWRRLIQERLDAGKVGAAAAAAAEEEEEEGKFFLVVIAPIKEAGYANLYFRDITDRKRAQDRQRFAVKVLELLNNPSESIDIVREILGLAKKFTGFDAIGLRLKQGGDYPYYFTNGFANDFVEAERYLCARDQKGELIRDSQGNPYLECMCGNIICGRTDPTKPFFTEGGSFWSNCTSELLATTTEKDRMARTR
ncbi:MAG: PAS domain-containing protein, partial [Candidatus Omnitrophica bacterium]|nr:PAS domain-containing protein [Candidatus Omnitrophota bacterium]